MKIRLYLDEDCARHALARELRARGTEVLTAVEGHMDGKEDEEQLEWANLQSRAIYSYNRGHFYRLHTAWMKSGRNHSGIILSRQDLSIGEQMRRLLHLINCITAEDMRNRVEFLSAWR